MEPNDVVLRFLASVGRPGEVALYVDLFRSQRPESFMSRSPRARCTSTSLSPPSDSARS